MLSTALIDALDCQRVSKNLTPVPVNAVLVWENANSGGF
jgi:hypothetical protein